MTISTDFARISTFEYDTISGFECTAKELAEVERVQRIMGDRLFKIELDQNKEKLVLKATQYVGVFRLGRQTVQVLPKMYRSHNSEDAKHAEAASNLLYMLEYTNRLNIKRGSLVGLLQQNLDWFEILTHLFAQNLREEWQRGAFRSYQSTQEVLPVLKGKWNLTEQLRYPNRKHLFSVTYDEFTADNHLNRILRYVVEKLWYLSRNDRNRRILHELRQWMGEVTLLPTLSLHDTQSIVIGRLNARYEPLLNLAKLFLDNQSLQLSAGNLQAFSFMFDINKLFEEFILSFIVRHREEILPLDLQDCEFFPQASQAMRYLATNANNEKVFQLKPDLILGQQGRFPLILDTKYKKLDIRDRNLGIAQSDFYQMYAYAHRYNCSHILLIYPQTADMREPIHAEFKLEGGDRKIVAATVDLCGDLGDFSERTKLAKRLNEIISAVR